MFKLLKNKRFQRRYGKCVGGILERRAETFQADGMAEGGENLVDRGCSILRSDVPGTGFHEETMAIVQN